VCEGSDETKKEVNIRRFWVYTSRMWGAKIPRRIQPKFFWKKISPTKSRVSNLVTIGSGV